MHQLLDTVVLLDDMPVIGLKRGDIGAVVDIPSLGHYAVEFVAASGRTQALITVAGDAIRALADTDLIAARSLVAAGH